MVLIGGVVILENTDGKHLLIQQSYNKPLGGKWRHPGGKFEPGEDPSSAMIREIREELGLEIILTQDTPVLELPSQYDNGTFGFYLGQYISGNLKVDPKEILSYGWFSLEEINKLDLMPGTLEFYHSSKNR